ncbi:hypothetical protein CEXT_134541 [Caerostris extrusa]|uniref:Uncharacterized protein n=1 Tax=Caerostris extrusa TaxID=172846 RepID=A0AAV4QQU2_CAEEX|nr:hypothetical protein CEXT_134541 [Caerostris extrusa]
MRTSYAHGGGEGEGRDKNLNSPSNDLTQIHNGASAATLPAFYPQECSSNPRLHIFARSEGSARNFPTLIWHSSGAGSLNFQDYKHGFSQSGFFRNLTRWIPGLPANSRNDMTSHRSSTDSHHYQYVGPYRLEKTLGKRAKLVSLTHVFGAGIPDTTLLGYSFAVL